MLKISGAAARYAASSSSAVFLARSSTLPCLRAPAPLRSFSASTRRAEDSKVRGTVADGAAGSGPAHTPSAREVVQGLGLEVPEGMDEAEMAIWVKLRDGLGPSKLRVQDVSGGCGSMYAIDIESEAFRGLGMLKQQRLVNQVIGEEIKGWHGVQLKTKAP